MKKLRTEKQKNLIKPGTIWQLGEHRLAYGDCRDGELLKKLIGKEKIKLICCDVPYGVAAVESKKDFSQATKHREILNDQIQTEASYRTFNREWLEAITPYLATKNASYIFNADKMVWALRDGMLDAGFRMAQLIIWIKSQAVIGRLDYAPMHELIVYGWHGTHTFHRSKDKSVIFYPRPSKSPFHPTTKPVGLIRRLILNSSDIGDIVFDGFIGGGTCILSCEQTKRKCIGVELDLNYCLVAINRWEKLTNRKAKKL